MQTLDKKGLEWATNIKKIDFKIKIVVKIKEDYFILFREIYEKI